MTDATIRPEQATTITELRDALTHEWYEASDGDYYGVPSWGQRTAYVQELIYASCPECDIASWDTTSADVADHRYLMRVSDSGRHYFRLYSHADAIASWEPRA